MYGKVNNNRAKKPRGYGTSLSYANKINIHQDWVTFWFSVHRKISYKKFFEAEIKKYEEIRRYTI